jgi:type IV secretion system protein VirD4
VIITLAAGLALLAALVWLWGGIAGALLGHGWPHVPLDVLLRVLIQLPGSVAHPADAWPASARARLPGTASLYGVFAVLAGLVTAAGAVGLRIARALGRAGGRSSDGARWASRRELRPLFRSRAVRGIWPHAGDRTRVPEAPGDEGRLVLGRAAGRMLYAERRHAVVAFGPPQSGKSAGVAIPALLEWPGPAIASSIKTDLVSVALQRRAELGEALIFDPFRLSGLPSHTWSPLRQAATWDGALEVAWRIAAAGELDQRGVEGGDFWTVAAEQRLAPLLFAAHQHGKGIEQVVSWAYGQGGRTLEEALARTAELARDAAQARDAGCAYDAMRAFEAQADRTRSSIEGTVQALLRAYRFARVARSAAGCEITADRLLDGPNTLFLIGDAKASKLLRPIFLALLGEVVDRAYERANEEGGRLRRGLLVCLDEAGNVAPLPNLAEVASTAPSHNIQLASIFHDLAQARGRYGGQTETVINSHRARMLLPGVADLETLRYFAGLVGEEEARELTRTTGAGGTSRSTGRRRRPLIAAETLRQLPDGTALLLYGRLPPVRIRLRRWFEDRRLRRLAGQTRSRRPRPAPAPGSRRAASDLSTSTKDG